MAFCVYIFSPYNVTPYKQVEGKGPANKEHWVTPKSATSGNEYGIAAGFVIGLMASSLWILYRLQRPRMAVKMVERGGVFPLLLLAAAPMLVCSGHDDAAESVGGMDPDTECACKTKLHMCCNQA